MRLEDFDFDLPQERIARFPSQKRGESRLMFIDRKKQSIKHYNFSQLSELIKEDKDFLVVNNSKVNPLRFFAKSGEAKVEILLIKKKDIFTYEALAMPAKKLKEGSIVDFSDDIKAEVLSCGERGLRILKFNEDLESFSQELGYAPLPPYIKRKEKEALVYREYDLDRYQTVFACDVFGMGSVAAPTAGLHFNNNQMEDIKQIIPVLELTLNVGSATFQKIEKEKLEEHNMGREYIYIPNDIREKISSLKCERNLIALGTTSVRSLETYALKKPIEEIFYSELFIYPGFKFNMVDSLITNFHLPQSSLFILTAAFTGLDLLKEAYSMAIKEKYNFFSYGDAMFIR